MRFQKSIFVHYTKIKLIEMLLLPLRLVKIRQNRVVLLSSVGYRFEGNTKFIAERIEKDNGLEIYYAVKKRNTDIEKAHPEIHFIKFGTLEYFYIVMSSKVFVTDGGGVSYIPFRRKQFLINTWHGGGAYKKTGVHAFGRTRLVKEYVRNDSKKYDVFLSSSRKFSEIMAATILVGGDVLSEVGMPRNDMLINGNEYEAERICRAFNTEGKRVILYAPTFRTFSKGIYAPEMPDCDIDVDGTLEKLEEKFGGEWVFFYRGHPHAENMNKDFSNAINVTQYEDMQELLLIADVLITDYSSSIWDFALTGKPGFLYATDIEAYEKWTGFETPMEEWPYPVCRNNEELISAIGAYEEEKAKAKIEEHLQALGCMETGHATEYVANLIMDVCGGKGKQ